MKTLNLPLAPTFARRYAELDKLAKKAAQKRDDHVRLAHAAGYSLREIGEALGISHSMVAKILAR